MQFDSVDTIKTYLTTFVSGSHLHASTGLDRMRYLLSLFDNPQDNYPSIHIAGTSGKWSTAWMTAQILQAHGLHVWLHVSPHLLDVRERVQIDGAYVSDTILLEWANELALAVEQCRASEYGMPTYYEVNLALAFYCFALANVDVVVVEVGAGGTYDGSNVITRTDKISVITRQWYDHQELLGDSLAEIASNDVGIVLPGSRVVALHQSEDVCNDVIEQWVKDREAILHWVLDPGSSPGWQVGWHMFGNVRLENRQTVFDYDAEKDICLALVWLFQAENAALAIATTQLFLPDFDRAKARQGLLQLGFVWRCDVRILWWKTVVLDGAHNPQKMQALVDTLRVLYPIKKIVWYTAFKQGKDREEMLDVMCNLSQKFVLWSFAWSQDIPFENIDLHAIVAYLSDAQIQECPDPCDFLRAMERYVWEDAVVVITGSLYWLSRVYSVLA